MLRLFIIRKKMDKQIIDYLQNKIKKIPYAFKNFYTLNDTDFSYNSIIEAKNCCIKIEISTRQVSLSISQKDNNWISMYWISKYLNMHYSIFTINKLKGNYVKTIKKQIDNCCDFIRNNIEILECFYNKNIESDLEIIRKKANQSLNQTLITKQIEIQL